MIQGLLFSRDRPLQLDAALRSFRRHLQAPECIDLTVLYRATSPRFSAQYDDLRAEYGSVRFVPETDFTGQVGLLVRRADGSPRLRDAARIWKGLVVGKPPHPVPAEDALLLFLVDDTVFVRRIDLSAVTTSLKENPDAIGFSFRLGKNTKDCYVLQREQQLPAFEPAGEGIVSFDWTKADGDFAYPLEISSSLYRRRTIEQLTRGVVFEDPNTLEGGLARAAPKMRRRHPRLLCGVQSAAFSAPINRVQAVYPNRSGARPDWSTEKLAGVFEQGLRIDVTALDGFVPAACHQEVDFHFVPNTA